MPRKRTGDDNVVPMKRGGKRQPDIDMTNEDEVLVPDLVDEDGTLIIHEDDEGPRRVYSQAERRKLSFAMRLSGATYKTIAAQLGVDIGTAVDDVRNEMEALGTEDLKALRTMYHSRLEMLLSTRWARALQGDDQALAAVLSILDRVERLYGLNGATPDEAAAGSEGQVIILAGTSVPVREALEQQKKAANKRD